MPEARDRRSNPLDVATTFSRRRASLLAGLDPQLDPLLFGSTPTRPPPPTGSGPPRVGFLTPRNGAGRGRFVHGAGAENISPLGSSRRGRGRRASRSVLPSWYPRTPLRDITAVVRAIERRRAHLGENEGQQTGTSFPADPLLPVPSVYDVAGASASFISSKSSGVKLQTPGGKVPKILLDIANQSDGVESEMTPQKKLLNSIDNVEKVVSEEIQRMKRTPSAKKAEREKRVRTLMSMR